MRWGVIGTGGIARSFVEDLHLLGGHEVVAVGSRTKARAQDFADRFAIPSRHASYEDLVADDDVDAVYVATPHPDHYRSARLAIDAGRHVLVEKPFTVNAFQAQDLVNRADVAGVTMLEAMWSRFLPHMVAIRELLSVGALGDVRTVMADHGQWFAPDPAHRIFAPALGGGALLDLGVYPVSFASMVLGPPHHIAAVSDPAMTGVDGQTSMILRDSGGRHAVLTTTSLARTAMTATIAGTDARIDIQAPFYRPTSFTVVGRDRVSVLHEFAHEGNGLRHQAAELARCVAAGEQQSPVLPWAETVSVMATMDEVRRQIGLRYDADEDPLVSD